MRYRLAAVFAAAALLAAATISTVLAASTDSQFHSTSSSCTHIQTVSSFAVSPAVSNTGYYYGSGCPTSYHVHAYFWGSDYQYHYYENTYSGGYGTAQVSYGWWTNDIYGYHNAPAGSGTTWTTHAY